MTISPDPHSMGGPTAAAAYQVPKPVVQKRIGVGSANPGRADAMSDHSYTNSEQAVASFPFAASRSSRSQRVNREPPKLRAAPGPFIRQPGTRGAVRYLKLQNLGGPKVRFRIGAHQPSKQAPRRISQFLHRLLWFVARHVEQSSTELKEWRTQTKGISNP